MKNNDYKKNYMKVNKFLAVKWTTIIEKEPKRIQAWLEIEPWPLQWHNVMLYPLSFLSSHLESMQANWSP